MVKNEDKKIESLLEEVIPRKLFIRSNLLPKVYHVLVEKGRENY